MKEYWSIPNANKAPRESCIAFWKHDGSNIRFEWTKKTGWSKFGTRRRLFYENDEIFGPSIRVFKETMADEIEKVIIDTDLYRNAQKITAYAEWEGPKSFAGKHHPKDSMDLILFDINVHRKGILDPETFLRLFGHLRIPEVIYKGILNDDFIQDVRDNKFELNEGVICKGGKGHKLWMCKIKTWAYKNKLKERLQGDWEDFWE